MYKFCIVIWKFSRFNTLVIFTLINPPYLSWNCRLYIFYNCSILLLHLITLYWQNTDRFLYESVLFYCLCIAFWYEILGAPGWRKVCYRNYSTQLPTRSTYRCWDWPGSKPFRVLHLRHLPAQQHPHLAQQVEL